MTEQQIVSEYRKNNPKSRAVSILKYIKNTASTKQRGCILCKWEGPTWSAKWPKTKIAIVEEEKHIKAHVSE